MWIVDLIKDEKQSQYKFRSRDEARAFAREKRTLGFAVGLHREPEAKALPAKPTAKKPAKPTVPATCVEARRNGTEEWGTLQTFTIGPKDERFERAHKALSQWLTTWHAAPEHEFRVVHKDIPSM